MRQVMLIVNPKAGKGNAKANLFTLCNAFCAMEDEVKVFVTQFGNHARQLVEEKAEQFDLLLCCGGDGTWNEVISGLMKVAQKPAVAYLPTGTVNDFASTLKLAKSPGKLMEHLATPTPFACDIGQFNKRYFTYVAAFGLFTEISYSTPQGSKNTFGKAAYFLEGIKQLTHIPRYHIVLETKDMRIEAVSYTHLPDSPHITFPAKYFESMHINGCLLFPQLLKLLHGNVFLYRYRLPYWLCRKCLKLAYLNN